MSNEDIECDIGSFIANQKEDFEALRRQISTVDSLLAQNKPASVLTSRSDYIRFLWSNCQERNTHIHRIATQEEQTSLEYLQQKQFGEMETLVFECFDSITERVATLQPPTVKDTHSSLTHHSEENIANYGMSHIKLPRINLATFSGQFTEWQTFRDTFVSLVKNNHLLDNLAKLHYLRSSLEKDALDIIRHVKLISCNFDVAWELLVKQYDNSICLVNAHLNALFSIEPLQKESASKLGALRHSMQNHIGALKSLGRNVTGYDDILINRVVALLDTRTKRDWELLLAGKENYPEYCDLDNFLLERIRALESISATTKDQVNSQVMSKKSQHFLVKTHHAATIENKCIICNETHTILKCKKFKECNPQDRYNLAKQHKLCINCLRTNHKVNDCKSKFDCFRCHGKHHTLLHRDKQINQSNIVNDNHESTSGMQISNQTHFSFRKTFGSKVLLATARAWIIAPNGRTIRVRVLLDQGSTCSFISHDLVKSLQLKQFNLNSTVEGVGGYTVSTPSRYVCMCISPNMNGEPAYSSTAFVVPNITSYVPNCSIHKCSWSHLADLKLADDPSNNDPSHVLIGADLYGMLLLEGIRKGQLGEPVAQKTVFGWVLSGDTRSQKSIFNSEITHHCISNKTLDNSLTRFWEIEEIASTPIPTVEDQLCEEHFRKTHERNREGKYIVRLPLKTSPLIDIGESRHTAEQVLKRTETRLSKHKDQLSLYLEFMQEYLSLNHMTLRKNLSTSNEDQKPTFLPHHPVMKHTSQTTKLRVVFNASSKTSNNTSLNDHMYTGPALQSDLSTILLNWRSYEFVYIADIAKMYRQILVNPLDVHHQCILWRESPQHPIDEYSLLTVTYGTRSAPYLALRVLQQLVEDEGHAFPLASDVLTHDTFVDDLLFGAHDINAAHDIRSQVSALLKEGTFQARKWASNCSKLVEDIDPKNHGLASFMVLGGSEDVKILGIKWNPLTDAFEFDVTIKPLEKVTKRMVLSLVAKLFDPLGWISPIIVIGKMFIQQLWRGKYSWDDPLPSEMIKSITSYFSSLPDISHLSIPRWTGYSPKVLDAQLHGFADASEKAYGAAVYLRVTMVTGETIVRLLTSKTKVAPIKFESIPRLELNAALILARLITSTLKARTMSKFSYQCWSDSNLVLTWLKNHASAWKTYIANRVSQIHTLLPEHVWRYVPTQFNPADLLSRGSSVHNLANSSLWWNGPPWLSQNGNHWPENSISCPDGSELEEKHHAHKAHIRELPIIGELFDKYSTWEKLLRVTAVVLKAATIFKMAPHCSRRHMHSKKELINVEDIRLAEKTVIKILQKILFPDELHALQNKNSIAKSSKLAALNPVLDDGIIKVDGRLSEADLDHKAKHPIVLGRHHVTTLIIIDAHHRCLHGGVQLTLNTIRQSYWILSPRAQVKSVIFKCIKCAKVRARLASQIMATLPRERVIKPNRPFTDCGVDYAGPLQLRIIGGRGRKAHPGYVVVFVCFAVKAIHLEVVSDYSSPTFIAAFKRFTSRRGLPERMYSDCGTTFKGATTELRTAFNQACTNSEFKELLIRDRISWHFNPPAAPHFGGLWEAGVKSVKTHLKRILGNITPTMEELTTLLCQIEAALNSRPLGPLHDHVESCDALTPGHFLVGGNLISLPQKSLIDINLNRLSRWSMMQQCYELFWRAWSHDYLQSLQQRTKWHLPQPNVKKGQLVLLKQPNLPPTKWMLGRIEECCPGSDGYVRVVRIKTANASFSRPITQIAILPIDLANSDHDSDNGPQSA